MTPWERQAAPDDPETRYTFVECRVAEHDRQRSGRQADAADVRRTTGYIDYFGRPWAQNWEKHFEQGWEKPAELRIQAVRS